VLYNKSFATNKEFIICPEILEATLPFEERCHIQAYLKSGKSKREISKLIGCTHTTINKEINRNSGLRGYRQNQAHEMATKQQIKSRQVAFKLTPSIVTFVRTALTENQWSPVQISGRLKNTQGIKISHETIYKLIWKDKAEGGSLYKHLRHKAKKYQKRGAKKSGSHLIPNRRDIDERPIIVEEKKRFGDFELDTIVGAHHKGAIVSVVDRASKFARLILIQQATSENVLHALTTALSPFKAQKMIHTFTSDNGKEFSSNPEITESLGGDFFFAKPYHSWERGLNEHTNGLVRQYFPKGTNFTILTPEQVSEVEHKLNNRPRKCLNFLTPCEALKALTSSSPPSGNFQG